MVARTLRCVDGSDLDGGQVGKDADKVPGRESRLPPVVRVLVQPELVRLILKVKPLSINTSLGEVLPSGSSTKALLGLPHSGL